MLDLFSIEYKYIMSNRVKNLLLQNPKTPIKFLLAMCHVEINFGPFQEPLAPGQDLFNKAGRVSHLVQQTRIISRITSEQGKGKTCLWHFVHIIEVITGGKYGERLILVSTVVAVVILHSSEAVACWHGNRPVVFICKGEDNDPYCWELRAFCF